MALTRGDSVTVSRHGVRLGGNPGKKNLQGGNLKKNNSRGVNQISSTLQGVNTYLPIYVYIKNCKSELNNMIEYKNLVQ
jgi:hypothetical protein